MSEDMNDAKARMPEPEASRENARDTISKLLDDRDRDSQHANLNNRDHPKREGRSETIPERSREERSAPEESRQGKPVPSETGNTPKDQGGGKDEDPSPASPSARETSSAGASLSELEALRAKLEKTEKVLAENQRYGRTNAQKVSSALKVAQKLTDDGLLSEEEAQELLETLRKGEPRREEGDARRDEGKQEDEGISHADHPQARLFGPIFKVANRELQNILKYTDDNLLQNKVAAFDYFLSVGSQEETVQVLEELTELLDDPVKLAKRMIAIGHKVYEESYRGIQEAGGFKNYLAQKDQELEKRQKKIDKLEKKLLQYEDFDQPGYRIEEMSDGDEATPATDTISTLFGERDKVKRR
jgi:hypothetical protein